MEHLLHDLLAGKRRVIWSPAVGKFAADVDQPPLGLLCGSFNPLHAGHRELRAVATRILGGEVGYELSIHNVEKSSLGTEQLIERCRQFAGAMTAVTTAATFVNKAELIPETTFVVGVDTAERIVDSRFYDGSERDMRQALAAIRDHACRFLVAGRLLENHFATLEHVNVPVGFADLFTEIVESDFRKDISSTALRDGFDFNSSPQRSKP